MEAGYQDGRYECYLPPGGKGTQTKLYYDYGYGEALERKKAQKRRERMSEFGAHQEHTPHSSWLEVLCIVGLIVAILAVVA